MWKKYRRAAGIFQAIIIAGIPFLKVKGESALRFDIQNLKLHFFGTVLWIKEFYLFLMAILFLLLLIVTITTILGRIWCGWLCPQTVLLDISDDVARSFSRKGNSFFRKLWLLPLSALVSLTLIWYFVPPFETMKALFTSRVVTGFFLVQWIIIYAELAFLGRKFCTSICPYSMLQSGLFDQDTLVISFDPSQKENCMGCDKCARVCPVEIDIKEGLRRECIACADCIDACVSMTKTRKIPPFIGYRGNILRPKTFVLGGVTVIFALTLLILFSIKTHVDFIITRDASQPVQGINRYTYSIQNNRNKSYTFQLSVKGQFTLIGERTIRLEPFSRIQGTVLVKPEADENRFFFLLEGDGMALEQEASFL